MLTSISAVTLGGAVLSIGRSSISFEDQATVTFNDNMAQLYGGAVFANKTIVYINGNSTVTFTGNHAAYGGAVLEFMSKLWSSTVKSSRNHANDSGGALMLYNSYVLLINTV